MWQVVGPYFAIRKRLWRILRRKKSTIPIRRFGKRERGVVLEETDFRAQLFEKEQHVPISLSIFYERNIRISNLSILVNVEIFIPSRFNQSVQIIFIIKLYL